MPFVAPAPPAGLQPDDARIRDDDWGQRLGCAAKIVGPPALPTADGRLHKNQPHLRHSLGFLDTVLSYLREQEIRLFRLPSGLVRYATHPDYPQLNWETQRHEAAAELAAIAERVQALGVRLSFHPSQYTLLSSADDAITTRAIEDLRWQCECLDALGCGPEARVFIHAGGVYGEREQTKARIIERIKALPDTVLARFALENDDVSWGSDDVLDICEATGIPCIWDWHHHWVLEPDKPWQESLARAIATWPEGVRPKMHLSTPRDPAAATKMGLRAHADYIDADVAQAVIEACQGLSASPDIMLEAKAKDAAVLALRAELAERNLLALP